MPEDILKNFFEDFFYVFKSDKSDVLINKSINFISNNIDAQRANATSVENFLYNLFSHIFDNTLTEYEKEYLVMEKDVGVSLFRKEHYTMPECFIDVLEFCSRDKTYEKVKYALINFMYSIING